MSHIPTTQFDSNSHLPFSDAQNSQKQAYKQLAKNATDVLKGLLV